MKQGELIKKVQLKKGINTVCLDQIYPIEPFKSKNHNIITFMIDDETMDDGIFYGNKIMIDAKSDETIELHVGQGFMASKDDALTDKFLSYKEWSGGDGIYSFNMTSGNDSFDQKEKIKTLFFFGDTFVGTSDLKTNKRYQPHLMPNNSFGIYENDHVDFLVNWQEDGSVSGFYKVDPKFDASGTIASNLTYYDRKEKNDGFVSGYRPKSLSIIFDLHIDRTISHMEFYNYFSDESPLLAKRGLKQITILGSHDGISYDSIKEVTLSMAEHKDDKEKVSLQKNYRYIKIEVPTISGVGNHNDESFDEGLYGLNLVKFFNHTHQLKDIYASSNSHLLKDYEHSWIWLQDGAIIGDYIYTLPMVINSDLNQPEGLQFCVKGVSLYKSKIVNGMPDYKNAEMKMAPLLVDSKTSQWLFGAAMTANTKQAGAKNPDGYIYVYGYKTTMGLRELVVARVLAERFEFFDDWRFYNGKDWVTDIFEAKGLLEHISCEMSVSELLDGPYQGKYIAVFTYDTNTPYVSFALGDSLVGPFNKPQKIYKTPEQEIFKSTTYTYNAKAHPHLSKSRDILVSYNTNTYNFDHNMSNNLIYRPRFIRLKDTF